RRDAGVSSSARHRQRPNRRRRAAHRPRRRSLFPIPRTAGRRRGARVGAVVEPDLAAPESPVRAAGRNGAGWRKGDSMTPGCENLAWPAERIPEAIERLAGRHGMPVEGAEAMPPLPRSASLAGERSGAWLEAVAAWLRLETTPAEINRGEIERLLNCASPAVLQLSADGAPLFVVLIAARGGRVTLLAPD